MRKMFVFLHRWIGLLTLVFLVVSALTGSIISFTKELDRALNPQWSYVVPQATPLPLDVLMQKAQAQFPGSRATYGRIEPKADRAWRFLVNIPPASKNGEMIKHTVFINPYTGDVLGTRKSGDVGLDRQHFIPLMSKIHYTLLVGTAGKWFMGVIALLWLINTLAGAYLAFPNRKTWMESFRIRWNSSSFRLNFDLHRAVSLWCLPLLVVLALSSVYLNLKAPFKWVVSQISPLTEVECACKVKANGNWLVDASTWGDAVQLAKENRPALTAASVTFFPDQAKYIVSMRGPDDIADSGMTKIYVNATNGELLHIHERSLETAGDTFIAWMFPLHSGKAFGLFGQIVICLSGIVTTLLSVTGYVIYSKKAKTQKVRKTSDDMIVSDGDSNLEYTNSLERKISIT